MREQKLTVVDIGSGSMKASVFEYKNGHVRQVAGISYAYRLCPEIGCPISERKGRIVDDFIKNVKKMSAKNGSNVIIAVATQAARSTSNFSDFQLGLEIEHGIKILAVSGEEEAKFFALTVRRMLGLDRFLSFDIGCGSIDIAKFDKKVTGAWSCPISCISLSKLGSIDAVNAEIDDGFSCINFADISSYDIIGSGGVLKVAVKIIKPQSKTCITYSALDELSKTIFNMTINERVKFGVPVSRADVMPYGLLIIMKLMQNAHAEKITLGPGDLRTGIAMKYFDGI